MTLSCWRVRAQRFVGDDSRLDIHYCRTGAQGNYPQIWGVEGVSGGCSFFHWTYSDRSRYWLSMVNTWRGAWNTNIRRISLILSSG